MKMESIAYLFITSCVIFVSSLKSLIALGPHVFICILYYIYRRLVSITQTLNLLRDNDIYLFILNIRMLPAAHICIWKENNTKSKYCKVSTFKYSAIISKMQFLYNCKNKVPYLFYLQFI